MPSVKKSSTAAESVGQKTWQKKAVIYQIWPNSFQDSNGDGVGDLQGIISRLDHLKDLGVDVLWLSPIYASPQADMGYDISDYRNINPLYGTLQDWDELLDGLHKRGMKLVMDLVVNHTSNEHPWFIESRSSKENPKRDWYFWRPAKIDKDGNKHPPNNWKSVWGDISAWKWDEHTQEYYLHLFAEEQPDLNWDNIEVREAIYDLMEFWLKKGIDGWRMDVINFVSKKEGLPDTAVSVPDKIYQFPMDVANGPHIHEYLQEMNRKVLSSKFICLECSLTAFKQLSTEYDIVTVGETPLTSDLDELAPYSIPSNKELQMVFTFELHNLDGVPPLDYQPWKLSEFKNVLDKYQRQLLEKGGWTSCYLENHDQGRSIPRWASQKPEYRSIGAKMLAVYHVACTGSLYIYQGEEIGMTSLPADWSIDEYQDIATQAYWKDHLEARQKETGQEKPDMEDVMKSIRLKARDHARSPVQWSDKPHAGFTEGKPWTRVNDDYKEWNVEAQEKDPDSVLNFWKKALKFRKANDACTFGHFHLYEPENEQVLAFLKTADDDSQKLLVVCNFTAQAQEFKVPSDLSLKNGALPVLSNVAEGKLLPEGGVIRLQAMEAGIWSI